MRVRVRQLGRVDESILHWTTLSCIQDESSASAFAEGSIGAQLRVRVRSLVDIPSMLASSNPSGNGA